MSHVPVDLKTEVDVPGDASKNVAHSAMLEGDKTEHDQIDEGPVAETCGPRVHQAVPNFGDTFVESAALQKRHCQERDWQANGKRIRGIRGDLAHNGQRPCAWHHSLHAHLPQMTSRAAQESPCLPHDKRLLLVPSFQIQRTTRQQALTGVVPNPHHDTAQQPRGDSSFCQPQRPRLDLGLQKWTPSKNSGNEGGNSKAPCGSHCSN
mmetsp:Transcript_50405/g.133935  ORF Transcript_50405/g.133935 Transcript_50405/m.133935 type:complete len:207 (+) Transcript_50405:371-991(+)